MAGLTTGVNGTGDQGFIGLGSNQSIKLNADNSVEISDLIAQSATETKAGLLEIATTAEAQALTDDLAALTPKKLADAFKGGNQSLAANGYQKLPGGLIVQWGVTSNISSASYSDITLPISFPTSFFYADAQQFRNSTGSLANTFYAYPLNTSTIRIYNATGSTLPANFIALGC